jgi:hypothetical protein
VTAWNLQHLEESYFASESLVSRHNLAIIPQG